MYKIGELVKRYSISRTALLYYDEIGLLKPSGRTEANYRLYSDSDLKRLDLIFMYRDMGVELKDIKRLLDEKRDSSKMLEAVLIKLDNDIQAIKSKQKKIVALLQKGEERQPAQADLFIDLIKSLGMEPKEFHTRFEHKSSEGHREFLEYLGFSDSEIEKVLEHINR